MGSLEYFRFLQNEWDLEWAETQWVELQAQLHNRNEFEKAPMTQSQITLPPDIRRKKNSKVETDVYQTNVPTSGILPFARF